MKNKSILIIFTVFVVLLSGCVSTSVSCTNPYKTINGRCCLDDNSDNICDDQQASEDKPDCQAWGENNRKCEDSSGFYQAGIICRDDRYIHQRMQYTCENNKCKQVTANLDLNDCGEVYIKSDGISHIPSCVVNSQGAECQ